MTGSSSGGFGMDIRPVSKEEAAFILGGGGKTKAKLATVSGAQLDLVDGRGEGSRGSRLEIRGTAQARERAKKYIDFVVRQRLGPVRIDNPEAHEDLTILLVPGDAVSFITGQRGSFLRLVEEELGALLFFLQINPRNPHPQPLNATERLAIFGSERARRGAELKVMAAIEMKNPGYFTKNLIPTDSDSEGFGTDVQLINEDDYSYALGKNATMRRKLAKASGCIVEYVGWMAYFCGLKKERRRAREYLGWLLAQRAGEPFELHNEAGRDDVTVIVVPRNSVSSVTGMRGLALRGVEEDTSTFCFVEGHPDDGEDQKSLYIFGRLDDRRMAETMVWEKIATRADDPSFAFVDDALSRKGKGKSKERRDWSELRGSKGQRTMDRYEAPDRHPPRQMGGDTANEFLNITDDDAAFLMGPGGKTKKKIAAVSGAQLDLKSNRLDIAGTTEERERARKYVNLVMSQRVGPVRLDDLEQHDDLSLVEVPGEAVSFVTGSKGSFLRLVEEEFGTLLFFMDFDKTSRREQLERLAIFGPMRERRGAELKVMAAIEMKHPGYFTGRDTHKPMCDGADGFNTDRIPIEEEDYSYALGKGGATRKKIARASGCIIEYIGRLAYLSGVKKERTRAREYLSWLFQQRIGPVEVDYFHRDDVTVIGVPKDCVGFVTGQKGSSLRAVEDATGTFCFIEGGRDDPYRDPKPLLIFGAPDARSQAEEKLRHKIDQKLEEGWVPEDHGGRYSDGKEGKGKGRKGDRGKGKGGYEDRWDYRGDRYDYGRSDRWERNDRWERSGRDRFQRNDTYGAASTAATSATLDSSSTAPVVREPVLPPAPSTPVAVTTETWRASEAAPQPAKDPAVRPVQALQTGIAVVSQEEASDDDGDGAWGNWGGGSDDEDQVSEPQPPPPLHAANRPANGSQPRSYPPAGGSAPTRRDDEEFTLPPQLMHEEAWPELGGLGGPSPKRKGRR